MNNNQIHRIQQREIAEISLILSDCNIIPVDFIKKLLVKRGKNESQISTIINQMIKRKLAYYDDSETFLRLNKGYSPNDMNNGHLKSLWLMLDLINNIDRYFIQFDSPHYLTFFNKAAEKNNENPIYDVFYIPYQSEMINEYTINNMHISLDDDNKKINAFIIIDCEEEIERLHFNESINVIAFVMIDIDGNISYIYPVKNDEKGE